MGSETFWYMREKHAFGYRPVEQAGYPASFRPAWDGRDVQAMLGIIPTR